ncbi:MAG: YbdD/YjiX family protein [Actinomycetota bacterium]
MRIAARRVGRGILWYLKASTGESKWGEYLERCRYEDVKPMSRKDFERHRTEHKENNPQARCC